MVDVLPALIDKQDTFETVGDQIAAILVAEFANQQALAIADAQDPTPWDIRVYLERARPWETYQDAAGDKTPLVNIWYDNGNFPKNKGNVVERQASEAVYNIDCYGYGISATDGGTGQKPGDLESVFETRRAVRLVRNILMSYLNTYLQLRGTVWQRWVNTITFFQPELNNVAIQNVTGARVAFGVTFNETAQQATGENLELITVDVKRTDDGEIVLETDYDYT